MTRLSSAVSAETLQKNLDMMGLQIKKLEKSLETFPPPQSDKDLFVENMSISLNLSHYRCTTIQVTGLMAEECFEKDSYQSLSESFLCHNNLPLAGLAVTPYAISVIIQSSAKKKT